MQATSPPQSSGTISYLVSCSLTRSGLAVGLSILLMATISLTLAALAWLMDSMVWGMMPSSAATTRTAMSVMFAPRARIEVNASWPGVSRKVMTLSLLLTWYAPMAWVMPPASPLVTLVLRMASRMEVLPWSTWPITTTTGGRSTRSAALSSSCTNRRSSMETWTSCSTLAWNSSAIRAAVSKSTTSEMACISPICMNLATTLAALCFRRVASSPTVISSGMEILSWALRAFSSWMRCRRSASVSRRRPNCWPRRLLRLLNFSFLPVGWFLRLLGMLRLSARSS